MKYGYISNAEYRRRVFNEALLECMSKVHGQVLNGACGECDKQTSEMADKMCRAFYTDMLKLDKNTVNATKVQLAESITFVKDCVNICEAIADQKAEDAKDVEMPDEEKVELSPEDDAVIEQLFDQKNPELQVEKIRDATVAALVAEDHKAQEVKEAIDIAKAQVADGTSDAQAMEETVNRINKRGPTSLMNAIINNISKTAVKRVNEAGTFTSIGKVLNENADTIKTRAVMAYSLYEMSSVMGIHKYAPGEVKQIAYDIYYEK